MKENSLIWLFTKIQKRVPAVFVLTAAQLGNALFSVLFALGSRGVIDSASAGDVSALYKACFCQFGIILGIILCMAVSRHLKERLTADLDMDWKRYLLHRLIHGEYASVKQYHSAELLNRMNNDVAKVNDGILSILPGLASMIMRLSAAVVVLGVLDPRFTAIIVFLGIMVVVATGFMRRWMKDLNKLVSTHDGRVSGFLQETLEKLLMVQSMDVSQEVEKRSDVMMEERYYILRKRKNVSLITNTGISVIFYGAGFFTLCWCAWKMFHGQMTFGSLTAVIQLVNQIQSPFLNLSGIIPQYVAMTASTERLMELDQIRSQSDIMEENRDALYKSMRCIMAEKLSFSYEDDNILEDAEFMLPKGAFAVITGPSGVGKSTLLKLLLGVYSPDSGELHINCGSCSKKLDRSTRSLFAYVPQGNLLMSGTIRDNLTIVKPDASEEEIRNATYVSAMDEFLPQLPMGLDTVLGESGAGLSEGQAQRLAIARAILGGAPILLLDECTSALDEDTEKTVLRRIRALPGRTCVAVTHRPAAIKLCDWRLQVNDGKIHAVWVDSRMSE